MTLEELQTLCKEATPLTWNYYHKHIQAMVPKLIKVAEIAQTSANTSFSIFSPGGQEYIVPALEGTIRGKLSEALKELEE